MGIFLLPMHSRTLRPILALPYPPMLQAVAPVSGSLLGAGIILVRDHGKA
jgi:hypothetical protein